MSITISDNFDAGNISVEDASNPEDIQLSIKFDVGNEHRQWFYFRVAGAKGTSLRMRITNASKCSYPGGWEDYRACTSVDREEWIRVPRTQYTDGELIIEDTPTADMVWYAYFAPFSLDKHQEVLTSCQLSSLARVDCLGATVDGRDLDRVVVGTGERVIWVIARQHPGESMASHWMEGFLSRLLDPDDPIARAVRKQATVHVVPHMNPDGSFRGHLRCNAAGANLNREWHAPTLERSPEVKLVRDAMDVSGVDLCLDVHGDEALPYNFIAGAEGIVGWSERLAQLQARFLASYVRANPDFQTEHGYPVTAPGQANMTICTPQIAKRFDCLSMTLEMPFKDNANSPSITYGWSPARCRCLGASALDPIHDVIGVLR